MMRKSAWGIVVGFSLAAASCLLPKLDFVGGAEGLPDAGGNGGSAGTSGSAGTGAVAGNGGVAGTGGIAGNAGVAGTGGIAGNAGVAGSGAVAGAGGVAGGLAGSAGTAGSAGAPVCSPSCGTLEQCAVGGLCVAKMVPIAVEGWATGYEIDATEVTKDQYEAWWPSALAKNFVQDAHCAWNTKLNPDPNCMLVEPECDASNCGSYPQGCVDWCDAYAYCKSVGKRLCGKIGGGANPIAASTDATQSQWYNACSSAGQNDVPYGGDAGILGNCDGYGQLPGCYTSACQAVPVSSLSSCVTPAGVYDLSGNVGEWEDSCSDAGSGGGDDNCLVRGGSYHTQDISCDSTWSPVTRNYLWGPVGFRCCSSP